MKTPNLKWFSWLLIRRITKCLKLCWYSQKIRMAAIAILCFLIDRSQRGMTRSTCLKEQRIFARRGKAACCKRGIEWKRKCTALLLAKRDSADNEKKSSNLSDSSVKSWDIQLFQLCYLGTIQIFSNQEGWVGGCRPNYYAITWN